VLPPLQPQIVLRGGGVDGDSGPDPGPAGPHRPGGPRILEDRTLTGSARIEVRRIVRATAEEGAMDVDVERVSVASDRPPTVSGADSESEAVETVPKGSPPRPSRPRKRGRGRPRKDGTGSFRPDSPTNEELVDGAFEGEVPPLRQVNLVPVADRPAVRRAGGRIPDRMQSHGFPSGYATSDEETGATARWRDSAIDRLDACDSKQAAVLVLEALDRVDKARGRSKNIKGDVGHDLRVSTAIARHAMLAVCQHSSHFNVDEASRGSINKLRSECFKLRQRTEELKKQLDTQTASRLYLLASRSRDQRPAVSPSTTPVPHGRGHKRNLGERRGEPDPVMHAEREAGVYDPLIPEIIMESPARAEVEPSRERPLTPLARYAAADPQVMGVLRNIVGSLRGLEKRMAALEGRPRPAPAPRQGRRGADLGSTPGASAGTTNTKRRKRRKKGDRGAGPQTIAVKRAVRPRAEERAEPLGPGVAPQRPRPGRRGPLRFPVWSPPARPSCPLRVHPRAPRGQQVAGRRRIKEGVQTRPLRLVQGLPRLSGDPHQHPSSLYPPESRRARQRPGRQPVKRRRDHGWPERLYRQTGHP